MDELDYMETGNINLEDLEYVQNIVVDDENEDGIFPKLDFMINIDDE